MSQHQDDVIDADVIADAERRYGKGDSGKAERDAFFAGYQSGWDDRYLEEQLTSPKGE